jgi:hypothetical protein
MSVSESVSLSRKPPYFLISDSGIETWSETQIEVSLSVSYLKL